jgi:hypothetical protein
LKSFLGTGQNELLIGNHVHNLQDDHIGEIKEIMLDMRSGKIAYAVMSHGGVFSLGEKLFAVPWGALTLYTVNKRFKQTLHSEYRQGTHRARARLRQRRLA